MYPYRKNFILPGGLFMPLSSVNILVSPAKIEILSEYFLYLVQFIYLLLLCTEQISSRS